MNRPLGFLSKACLCIFLLLLAAPNLVHAAPAFEARPFAPESLQNANMKTRRQMLLFFLGAGTASMEANGGIKKTPNRKAAEIRKSIVNRALNLEGCPYCIGSKGPKSFDCSGFVKWVLDAEVGPQHMAHKDADSKGYRATLRAANALIEADRARPGDIIYFYPRKKGKYGHIGIIVDPVARTFITAQASGIGVKPASYAKGGYFGDRAHDIYKNIWVE